MKQFIHDTVFVLFFGLLVVLVLETLTRQISSDNVYAFKYDYMESHSSEIKTLLLGHSLFEESFNSNVLGDSTFNLAICGRVSYYDVKLLEHYIDRMPNLKTVIFPIHYALDNPCEYYDSDGEEGYVYHYYKYMKIKTPGSMNLYYLPKLTFRVCVRGGQNVDIESVTESGYAKLSDKSSGIYPPSERSYTQAHQEEFCNHLHRIAQLCHEHQVRFIAVTPPATDIYLTYTTADGINRINRIIEDVRKDYLIEYRNYIADSSFRSDSLYYDCVHLNHQGATRFANCVKDDFNL